MFSLTDVPLSLHDLRPWLESQKFPIVKQYKQRIKRSIEVYNIPVAYDTEFTSTEDDNGNKIAFVYAHALAINGQPFLFREWDEILSAWDILRDVLGLWDERLLYVYVRNLSCEFQFMRKRIEWGAVFSLEDRVPVKAVSRGIEYRCSLKLSGMSLAESGKRLTRYHVEKRVGDLDYDLIRTPETPLTNKECGYIVYDVLVDSAFIQEKIEDEKKITNIPLTKTGYVRRYIRKQCMTPTKEDRYKYHHYRNLMSTLTMTVDEYKQAKRAFHGGFTHANVCHSGKTMSNVDSYDFASSYPAVMVSCRFPMSRGRLIPRPTREQFSDALRRFCCLFDVEFRGLKASDLCENPISASKCWYSERVEENNGRVVSARCVRLSMTDVDFRIVSWYYTWDSIRVINLRTYSRGYLPRDFVLSILKLYGDKTSLKDVPGAELDYAKSKEMINSAFGMCVTDVVKDDIVYDNDVGWATIAADEDKLEEEIKRYNSSPTRFLSYLWGVWVTSYAQYRLFKYGIKPAGLDYIYADTDSVKLRNGEAHAAHFVTASEEISRVMANALREQGIDPALAHPKTVKGKEKPLGVWAHETEVEPYRKFKTLGAKRYMYDESGKVKITVAGLSKQDGARYMVSEFGDRVFDEFKDGLYIPAGSTGKLTHTYIDYEFSGEIVDYTGRVGHYHELSALHLSPCEYSLSLADAYANYILRIQERIDEDV